MLLGTLQKFKQDSACKTDKDVRREEINKKLEEAETKEKEQVINQKKELFTSRRAKQAELKKLEWKVEIMALQEEWDNNGKKLCNSIKTKTKPHIHYLPAKHTDRTSKLLEESSRATKRAMAERRARIEEELEAQDELEKSSKEEGKGKTESVPKIEKESNSAGRDKDVNMETFEDMSKPSHPVSNSERGDTRQVILKDENGESMEVGE